MSADQSTQRFDSTYGSMSKTWQRRFFGLAKEVSSWSKDPSTKVGAAIVDKEKVVVSMGWNGLPRGMDDSKTRLADREFKLRHTIHAELNAVLNASRLGIKLEGTSMFVVGLPTCSDCAKAIVQAGIKKVYMCYPVGERPDWEESYSHSQRLFDEVGVVTEIVDSGFMS